MNMMIMDDTSDVVNCKSNYIFRHAYFFSVALSPIAPVVHYSLWIICIVLAIFELSKNNWRPRVPLFGVGKRSLWLLLILTIWVCIAGLFTFAGIDPYFRNVAMSFEFTLGAYFATQTREMEIARARFAKILVICSLFILAGQILRLLGCISYFPNRSLKNGNNLGCLAMLLFPVLACYALWCVKSLLARVFLLLPLVMVLVLSFSSGAWLTVFAGSLVILYYGLKNKKITVRLIVMWTIIMCVIFSSLDYLAHGKFSRRLLVEVSQAKSFDNMDKFTTLRNQIWRACWYMTKRRPILGYGGDLFINQYRLLAQKAKLARKIGLTVKREVYHPHSTYFNLLYIGGVPALLLFLAILFILIRKSHSLAGVEYTAYFPWAIVALVLFIEFLVYGTVGDVLKGKRDISVIMWSIIGITAILPDIDTIHKEVNN